MARITLNPSSSGLWRVGGLNDTLHRSRQHEAESWPEAAQMRFDAVQALLDKLGEEDILLDWEDRPTRAAIELIYVAAADQLIIGEVETAAALWEVLLSVDEEDHMSASVPLAFCYVALEDYDCWEEIMFSISSKSPEYHLLTLWAEYRRTGGIEQNSLHELRTRHKDWWREFTSEEHPADEEYLADCQNERPSATTQARQLWFATAPLWAEEGAFIKKVK